MNDKQFEEICKRLDKILAVLTIQNLEDKNDKIYTLKKLGLSSEDIAILVGVKNPRQMEGWKRK
jgi:hypothetical protein